MRLSPGVSDAGAVSPATAETHSAVVVFLGDRAYKLKKPVDLGFLDFTTREARLEACRREYELNRRLAPDVYLGVTDVVDETGAPCDHLLVMRRMPPERRLSTLIRDGRDVTDDVRAIARRVGEFHLEAATVDDPGSYAGAAAVRANWDDNLATLRRFEEVIDAGEREHVGELAARYLDGRQPLLEARIAAGRVRDGHGDLLADDIFCLDDGPRILDCLDFSARYRCGDVLLDAAFLSMDLERQGRPELARSFLRWWAEATGEEHPTSLADHYIAYRAHVRAKVACLRAHQGLAGAADTARHLHALAARHLEAARVRLVLVGGAPGTGKSTLARGLAQATGWTLLRSDEVRKELAGLGHLADGSAPPGEGLYRPEAVADTYEELATRARGHLAGGEPVILDATWSSAAHREQAVRVAEETRSDLIALRCELPVEIAEQRLLARGADASDASVDVARQLATTADPWPQAVTVDTSAPPEEVVAAALGHVGPHDAV